MFFVLAVEDYLFVSQNISLESPDGVSQCLEVDIVDDNVLEMNESFLISATTTHVGVLFVISEAVITIVDNEG